VASPQRDYAEMMLATTMSEAITELQERFGTTAAAP
jgi:hypothetical protein